jgi:hypothetical protein
MLGDGQATLQGVRLPRQVQPGVNVARCIRQPWPKGNRIDAHADRSAPEADRCGSALLFLGSREKRQTSEPAHN